MELLNIPGVGPKLETKLKSLGINNVSELLNYFPYGYNFYYLEKELRNTSDTITVKCVIETEPKVFYIKKNLNRLSFRGLVGNTLVNVVIFNRAFMKNNLHVNKTITLHGTYNQNKNLFTASNIFINELPEEMIEPKYHLTSGITNKEIIKIIGSALKIPQTYQEVLPESLCQEYKFMDRGNALQVIHNPKDVKMLKQAKLRFIYEELFNFMFKINLLKYNNSLNTDSLIRNVEWKVVEEFINNLPFALTVDQLKAVEEIYNDLTSNKRMNRLLLGDVGSGKTIVSFAALYINYKAGYQGALMAPTEILARQHYEGIKKIFDSYNIRSCLLVGSMTAKEKRNAAKLIEEGSVDIVIGTHALISDNVLFSNLGLAITDEQHRFGVNQRGNLINKGTKCDLLYLSATPIPRTYALTIYGDMDTSIIKSKISGRKEIITSVVKENDIKSVLHKILEEIKENHQVYVVAPLIEEKEESNLNDVMKLKEKFEMAFNNKVSIGILHGKMKKDEKEEIMEKFKNNEIKVLISTTVIEVGVDVKNSTIMMIFNAERFGLATLHQLRGRVGRNDLQSYCFLICNNEIERLKVLEESNDGFYISEKDFELRGQGDLFGVRQSGDMSFKIANLKTDYKILVQAKKDSYEFIEKNIDSKFKDYPLYEEIYSNMTIY